MNIIENIKNRARMNIKTIVLPESEDWRVLEAAVMAKNEGIAKIILLGNKDKALKVANEKGIDISDIDFIEVEQSEKLDEYAQVLYECRKNKGMTIEEAKKLVLDPVYYGMMMLKCNDADGLVSGACHSTADTLRPALQIIRTKEGEKLVSAFFLMNVPNCIYGEEGVFLFADCALNESPDSETIAEIAASSVKTFEKLVERESRVAMLSYSTYGSKVSELSDKMKNATEIFKQRYSNVKVDGEVQLDAAIVPEVMLNKNGKSETGGRCNTLIFPDINAGNIGYKLVQKLAKAEAYGPICQGIAKPVNDLSRGCCSKDIVGVIAITAVQAQ